MKQKQIIRKSSVILVLSLLLIGLLTASALAYGDWTAGGSSPTAKVNTSTIEFQQANMQDVLSALAIKTGTTVMLVGEDTSSIKVDFKTQGISPARALDLIVEKQGMESIQRGNIVLVGKSDVLTKNFANELMLTRIDTYNVSAEKMVGILSSMGVDVKSVTLDTNSNAFWVQGTAQALQKVREIASAVDISGSQTSFDYKVIAPKKISTSKMITLLSKAGVTFSRYVEVNKSIYVFDKQYFARWNQIIALAKQLDITSSTTEDKVIVYRCKYVCAKDAAVWLKQFSFGQTKSATTTITNSEETDFSAADIKTITFNNDPFGTDLTVICPPELESQVISALNQIDVKRKEVKVPLTKASYQKCNALRVFINELTGVPVSKLHISSDLAEAGTAAPSKEYVLWIEESPDTIQLVQDVLAQAGV